MIVIWHMLDLVEPQACFIGMQTLFHSKFYHYPYPIISIIGWDLVLWWVHMFVVWGSGILCKWQNEWIPIHHPSIVLTRGLITKPEHTPIDVLLGLAKYGFCVCRIQLPSQQWIPCHRLLMWTILSPDILPLLILPLGLPLYFVFIYFYRDFGFGLWWEGLGENVLVFCGLGCGVLTFLGGGKLAKLAWHNEMGSVYPSHRDIFQTTVWNSMTPPCWPISELHKSKIEIFTNPLKLTNFMMTPLGFLYNL